MSGPWEDYAPRAVPAEGPWNDYQGPVPAAKPKQVGSVERTRAAAAGVNKGFYADLFGLPVDTITSAVDLVKAGIGFTYNEGKQMVTGKRSAPPESGENEGNADAGAAEPAAWPRE